MKSLFILSLCLSIVLFSCSKIKEASDTIKTGVKAAQSTKDIVAETSEQMMKGDEVEISEERLRKYYTAVKTLNQNHPDMDFENALGVAIQSGLGKSDIKRIIEKETNLSYDEYNEISAAIMTIAVLGVGVEMVQITCDMAKQGIETMENMDVSDFSDEDKKKLEEEIEKQKAALTEAEKELQSEEYLKKKEKVEILKKIREEMGF